MNVTPRRTGTVSGQGFSPCSMALVDPDYRNEFAVLATWLCMFLPWSVWYFSGGLTVVEIRFPLAVVRTVSGLPDGGRPSVATPVRWAEANAGNPSALAYWLAAAGLVVFAVALAASLALYLREARVERALPADPATVQGGLLLAAGLALGAATVRSFTSQPGLVVPIGAPFLLAFGAVLIAGKQSA